MLSVFCIFKLQFNSVRFSWVLRSHNLPTKVFLEFALAYQVAVYMKKVIGILGPTAVGKSSIANKLAVKLGGQILICDTLQFYKNYPISSNWPSLAQRQRIPYPNLGKLDPFFDKLDVFKASKLLHEYAEQIHNRHRLPIIQGGSTLYFKQFMSGSEGMDEEKLQKYKEMAVEFLDRRKVVEGTTSEDSWSEMKGIVETELGLPAQSLRTINRNDMYRLLHKIAYVLYEKHEGDVTVNKIPARPKYDYRIFVLYDQGPQMVQRINNRCLDILSNGFFTEMAQLHQEYLSHPNPNPNLPTPLGFDKAVRLLKLASDPAASPTLLKTQLRAFYRLYQDNTRAYFKRQMTYLRKYFKQAVWVKAGQQTDRIELLSKSARMDYLDEVTRTKVAGPCDFQQAKSLEMGDREERRLVAKLFEMRRG